MIVKRVGGAASWHAEGRHELMPEFDAAEDDAEGWCDEGATVEAEEDSSGGGEEDCVFWIC